MKILACLCLAACASSPAADSDLSKTIASRYAGDRTGACIAAAVIDGDDVQRATVCAGTARSVDGAFEIGSVSKTIDASLLADLIDQGKIALRDPIRRYLPAGTPVPTFAGAEILVEHLVTHTAGLPRMPSRIVSDDPADPYAQLDPSTLFASLADVTLAQAPGAKWAYSNFGAMLLSYIVSTVAGGDFETVAKARLFAPLEMTGAYVDHPGAAALPGHRSTGEVTPAWHFPAQLAGVGGVRATLDDMVRYAQGELGRGDAHTVEILRRTHAAIDLGMPRPDGDPEMAMGWLIGHLDDRAVLVHDGGTGGFSSFVAIEPEADRAIVVLSDTQLDATGGLGELALHLLDARQPLGAPRTVATPSAALVASLAGRYQLGDLVVTLRAESGALVASTDQGELAFGYDSHGDFFTHEIDAVLTPMLDAAGQQTFAWVEGGEPAVATRL